MKQISFDSNLKARKMRKQAFLYQMNQVVPSSELVPQLLGFSHLSDESAILPFGYRLKKHKLTKQVLATVYFMLEQGGLLLKAMATVDNTLISAPSITKNRVKVRYPEMHLSQKGKDWYLGIKACIGVDADSGLAHIVPGTFGNVIFVTGGVRLLHGQEADTFDNSSYEDAAKRADAKEKYKWHVVTRQGKCKKLYKAINLINAIINKVEKIKASISSKVEYPFRVIRCQFRFSKYATADLRKTFCSLRCSSSFSICRWSASTWWRLGHKCAYKQPKRPFESKVVFSFKTV